MLQDVMRPGGPQLAGCKLLTSKKERFTDASLASAGLPAGKSSSSSAHAASASPKAKVSEQQQKQQATRQSAEEGSYTQRFLPQPVHRPARFRCPASKRYTGVVGTRPSTRDIVLCTEGRAKTGSFNASPAGLSHVHAKFLYTEMI